MTVPAYQPPLPLDLPSIRTPVSPAGDGPAGQPGDRPAQARLLAAVATRYPRDALTWLPDGQPAVLARLVALGTYGRVSGLDEHGATVTAEGYIQQARSVRGGLGGRHDAALVVMHLGERPDGPNTVVVQAFPDDRVHIRWPPPDDMPPGALAPWLRLPVQHQILAARHLLGLDIEVVDGPFNPLWTVEGCPHQLTGDVARWLFGGRYGSWDGRARPVFDPRHLDQAIAAGRVQPDGRPWQHTPHRPIPPPWFGTGQVPGIEARRRTVTAALAQALTYGVIAETAASSTQVGFRTVDGRTVDHDQLATYLAAAATSTTGAQVPVLAGTWRGVQVSFQRADNGSALLRLSGNGTSHIAISVTRGQVAERPHTMVAALTDAVSNAATRGVVLSEAANALADYLACARGWATDPPAPPAAAAFGGRLPDSTNTRALPAPAATEPQTGPRSRSPGGR